jgi:hypothetical protein
VPVSDNGVVVHYTVPVRPVPTAPVDEVVYNPTYLFPGKYDISVYRGDTYEWWFTLNVFDVALGMLLPVNITGWRFKAEIRPGVDAPLQAAMQEVGRDDLGGVIAMRLVHDQSRLLTSGGVWDLEAITPDGWVRTVLAGLVTLVGDVTTGFVDYSTEYSNLKVR